MRVYRLAGVQISSDLYYDDLIFIIIYEKAYQHIKSSTQIHRLHEFLVVECCNMYFRYAFSSTNFENLNFLYYTRNIFSFINLVRNFVFIPKCHLKAIQDDITEKKIFLYLTLPVRILQYFAWKKTSSGKKWAILTKIFLWYLKMDRFVVFTRARTT